MLWPASRRWSAAASASAWVSNRSRSHVPSGAMAWKMVMRRSSGLAASLGMLALLEGAVGDPLQQLGVVPEGADMAPVDLVGVVVEVIVAERLEPSKHRVDLGLLGDEGGERLLVRLGDLVLQPRAHLRAPHRRLCEPMNASIGAQIKQKRRSGPETYDLTSRHLYGW